jgi:hypothetical protein
MEGVGIFYGSYLGQVCGIFFGHWYILWLFGIFYGYLIDFMVIWYILWLFGKFFTFWYIVHTNRNLATLFCGRQP